MGVRENYVPEDFIKVLRHNNWGLKGFSKLPAETQAKLAYYIFHAGTWRRKHKHPAMSDYMSISYKELERDFGRGKFKTLNGKLKVFKVTPNWHKDKGYTKGYMLTDQVDKIRSRYLEPRERPLTRLISTNGLALRTMLSPVLSKDTKGITRKAWKTAKPLNAIPIDSKLLKSLYAHLTRREDGTITDLFAKAEQDDTKYLAEKIGKLLALARTDIAGRDTIMHTYIEAKTGRLYAKGESLQNAPKDIKAAALHGLYEYDFENCHFAIFSQMAARYGYEAEGVNHYVRKKREVRSTLSTDLGLAIDDVKMCLIALMYGAHTSIWHENTIPKTIGAERAEALYEHPLFVALDTDLKEGGEAILQGWPKRRTTMLNAADKWVGNKEPKRVRLAHLIQGVEAKALERAIELYPDDILLLMHDGFVTSGTVDTRLIEREILKATGYRLELTGGVITLPPDIGFFQNVQSSES